MMDMKVSKRQQKTSKERQETIMSSNYRTSKRKTLKNTSEGQEIIKGKLVKLFCMAEKEQINAKELKSMLLTLGYHGQDARQLIYDYNTSRGIKDQDYQYKICQVYQMCERNPPKDKWKRESFDLFSSDKNCITLEDLETVWVELTKGESEIIKYEDLKEVIRQFGTSSPASMTLQNFDFLLQAINLFAD